MEDDNESEFENSNHSFMHKSEENQKYMQSSIDSTEIRVS